jgi:hypothetical protein
MPHQPLWSGGTALAQGGASGAGDAPFQAARRLGTMCGQDRVGAEGVRSRAPAPTTCPP